MPACNNSVRGIITDSPLGTMVKMFRSVERSADLPEEMGVEVGRNVTGSGFFFYTVCGSNRADPVQLRTVRVKGFRLRSKEDGVGCCLFVECRTLTVLKKRGLGALIAIKKPGRAEYKLGVCLAVDLHSVAYLEWNGPHSALEHLFRVGRGRETFDDIRDFLTNDVLVLRSDRREGSRKGKLGLPYPDLHFLNIVRGSDEWSKGLVYANPDTVDGIDGCYSYSALGPDCVLSRPYIPTDLLENATEALGDGLTIVTPPAERKVVGAGQRRVPKVRRGNFLLVAQRRLDCTMRGGTSICVDGLKKSETASDAIDVPFLCVDPIGSKMAKIQRSKIESLVRESDQSGGLSPSQFDERLLQIADFVKEDSVVVDYRGGDGDTNLLWIVSVDATDLQWIQVKCKHSEYLGSGGTHRLIVDADLREVQDSLRGQGHFMTGSGDLLPEGLRSFPREVVDALVDVYGPMGSFGDRKCSVRMGYNTYQGPRNTGATRANPVCGRETLAVVDYWTESYSNIHALVALNPLVNLISNEVAKTGRLLHSEHAGLIEKGAVLPGECKHGGICANFILTGGLLGKILSFGNSTHTDGDGVAKTLEGDMIKTLQDESRPNQTKRKRDHERKVRIPEAEGIYLESWLARFGGFDSFTTCGYGEVGRADLPEGAVVYQFFNMPGMAVNARLGAGVTHSFFAQRFAHSTALAVGVSRGRVFLQHPSYCVFAWGLGNPVDDCVARRTRSRVRQRREATRERARRRRQAGS